jgi:OOP family OmpA-OmpF porin
MALLDRQVDVSGMRAVGYGETVPIADNTTEAGRETNRRIEFTLTAAIKGPSTEKTTKGAVETAPDGTPLAPDKPMIKPPARPKG